MVRSLLTIWALVVAPATACVGLFLALAEPVTRWPGVVLAAGGALLTIAAVHAASELWGWRTQAAESEQRALAEEEYVRRAPITRPTPKPRRRETPPPAPSIAA